MLKQSLYKYWPKTGGIIAFSVLVYVFLFSEADILNLKSLCWLNVSLLMMHQFEEYVLPGGFKDFFNKNMYNKNILLSNKLNDAGVFHVNVTIAWTAFFVCAIINSPFFLMVLLLINFINGLLHITLAIGSRKYNPGFVTSLLLFMPFPIFTILFFIQNDLIAHLNWISVLILASGGSLLIPLTLYLTRNQEKN